MGGLSGNTTSPRLLQRVADWRDDLAWNEFFTMYDPLVRRWSGVYRLNNDDAEELHQRIWVELASRVRTFRYDPGLTFRGWLRQLVRFRGLDQLRKSKGERPLSLDEWQMDPLSRSESSGMPGDDETEVESSSQRAFLHEIAEQAQDAVRARVAPDSWRAFWLIAIEDWAIRDAAEHLGKKYVAVFRVHQRVGQMLRDEGRRLLSEPIAMTSKPRG